MIKVGLAFVAGAIVGGLIVREIAIRDTVRSAGSLVDRLFGDDSYAGGATKTTLNAFLRN